MQIRVNHELHQVKVYVWCKVKLLKFSFDLLTLKVMTYFTNPTSWCLIPLLKSETTYDLSFCKDYFQNGTYDILCSH